MPRTTFILISGAWHASWCWHKIVRRLEEAGCRALTPDLSGYGEDRTAHSTITLEDWTRQIGEVVDAQSEAVILVGHSRAGIVISQVAERMPERVKCLVYVSGFLLQSGESILRGLRKDGDSPLLSLVNLTEDKNSWIVAESAITELFYGECAQSDISLAHSRLSAEPAEPLMKSVRVTEKNFGRVPRIYVECLRDKAVPAALQKSMYTALPCSRVVSIDTDHSPFLSRPAELAAHLLSASAYAAG